MKKFLVTGGAGAIGSNFVNLVISRYGNEAVMVIDDLSSGHRRLLPDDCRFLKGSVTDQNVLDEAASWNPDYVIHMAALFANQNSVDHPERDLEVNGLGTMRMLEFSKRVSVEKMVYISSSCVYGSKEMMKETDTDFWPDTPYAITKLLGERYATFWAHQHELNVVSLRLFNTYGPREFPGQYRNVIPNFMVRALNGLPLIITGTGQETRDFTFVEDTVAGILAAAECITVPGEVFNIASGKETRVIEMAELVNKVCGNSAGIEFIERRSWDSVLRRRADISKAEEKLDYRPRTGLEQGLEKTIAWLRESR